MYRTTIFWCRPRMACHERAPLNGVKRGESNGGADRDRTDDLVIANDALFRLSYSPIPKKVGPSIICRHGFVNFFEGSNLYRKKASVCVAL